MISDAGRQGVDVSTNDDTDVSAQTDTLTGDPGSEVTTKQSDMDASEKDSNMDKMGMEQAVDSASAGKPTAQSKPRNTGSETFSSEQKSSDSCKDVTEDEMKRDSGLLRPRTDSNLSKGSSEVNWEELQKTENQHVQEEGSDEVSFRHLLL